MMRSPAHVTVMVSAAARWISVGIESLADRVNRAMVARSLVTGREREGENARAQLTRYNVEHMEDHGGPRSLARTTDVCTCVRGI